MNFLHVGKSLSCIAATSTIGAVAVIPKVRSTLVSLEKEIDTLKDLKLSNLVEVSETKTNDESPENTKKEAIKALILRVNSWLSSNGGCKIRLSITSKEGEYYEVKGEGETTDINHSLFVSNNGMRGKSKFERLADDLTGENERKGDNATKYSEYLKGFKERCQNNNNKVLKLQWKSQIPENKDTQDNTHSEKLKGLINLWVDEKEDATKSE